MKPIPSFVRNLALPALLTFAPGCLTMDSFSALRNRLHASLSSTQEGLQKDGSFVSCVGHRNRALALELAVQNARVRLRYLTQCPEDAIRIQIAKEENGNLVCAKATCITKK
jgi:hypothetical protein